MYLKRFVFNCEGDLVVDNNFFTVTRLQLISFIVDTGPESLHCFISYTVYVNKALEFIQTGNYPILNKDPTGKYQKEIKQPLEKCKILINTSDKNKLLLKNTTTTIIFTYHIRQRKLSYQNSSFMCNCTIKQSF